MCRKKKLKTLFFETVECRKDQNIWELKYSVKIIEKHVLNIKSLTDYENDLKTIDAVERRLSIIGEALNKALRLNPQLHLSNKNKIVGLRHLLVHNYNSSDDATIWTVIQKHLPILKKKLNYY